MKTLIWTVTVVAVLAAILWWIYYDNQPRSGSAQSDPLCSYVSGSKFRCVAVLGSDALLGPGALVDYPAGSPPQNPVPLPNAELFSSTCLIPGQKADALKDAFKAQQTENTVSIPAQSYDFNRSFKAGLDVPVPRLYNLSIKAGPNVSQLQKVTFQAKQAWVKYIDENVLLELLAEAGIKQSCIDHLLTSNYSVVSRALIAQELTYEVTDKNGQAYSFSAATEKGQLQVSGGGNTTIDSNRASQILATTPVVLGVSFLNPSLFANKKAQLEAPVVFSSTGHVVVSAAGLGGQGAFGTIGDRRPAGLLATAAAVGTERSECEADHDLTLSKADLHAHVRTPASNSIAISGSGEIRGGHYATGTCIAGRLVGASGHDTGVSGQYIFTGSTRAVVRSETARLLTIEFSGLPEGTSIDVQDPVGRSLPAEEAQRSPSTVAGSGRLNFSISGAGIYTVFLSSTVSRAVNGAGTAQMSTEGNISVHVE